MSCGWLVAFEVSAAGLLNDFRRWERGWNKCIDSLSTSAKKSCDVLIRVSSATLPFKCCHALLVHASVKPKMQVWALVRPVDRALCSIFSADLDHLPYEVEVATTRSRLASSRDGVPAFMGVHFVTSGEIQLGLASSGRADWQWAQAEYEVVPLGATLLRMRVQRFSDAVNLHTAAAARDKSEDTVLAFLRTQQLMEQNKRARLCQGKGYGHVV